MCRRKKRKADGGDQPDSVSKRQAVEHSAPAQAHTPPARAHYAQAGAADAAGGSQAGDDAPSLALQQSASDSMVHSAHCTQTYSSTCYNMHA